MHDGVQYGPIRGQGQGHEPMKVGNSTIGLANDHRFLN